jgi:hypothetical protein
MKTLNSKSKTWWKYEIAPESLEELSDSDRRNAKSLNHWILVWGIVFFGIVLGTEPLLGNIEVALVWRLLPACSAILMTIFLIRAYIIFYRETKDELLRKIHYMSLAVGFGAAFFLGACFGVLATIFGNLEIARPLTFAGMLIAYFTSHALFIHRNHYV